MRNTSGFTPLRTTYADRGYSVEIRSFEVGDTDEHGGIMDRPGMQVVIGRQGACCVDVSTRMHHADLDRATAWAAHAVTGLLLPPPADSQPAEYP